MHHGIPYGLHETGRVYMDGNPMKISLNQDAHCADHADVHGLAAQKCLTGDFAFLDTVDTTSHLHCDQVHEDTELSDRRHCSPGMDGVSQRCNDDPAKSSGQASQCQTTGAVTTLLNSEGGIRLMQSTWPNLSEGQSVAYDTSWQPTQCSPF